MASRFKQPGMIFMPGRHVFEIDRLPPEAAGYRLCLARQGLPDGLLASIDILWRPPASAPWAPLRQGLRLLGGIMTQRDGQPAPQTIFRQEWPGAYDARKRRQQQRGRAIRVELTARQVFTTTLVLEPV